MKINFKVKKILAGLAVSAVLFTCNSGLIQAQPENKPYDITAGTIEYDLSSGAGSAEGNVLIKNDGGQLMADRAEFNSKNTTAHLFGSVHGNKDGMGIKSNELVMHDKSYFTASGNASITKEDKTLKAPRIDYHADSKTAATSGGRALLTASDGSSVSADRLDYNMANGVVTAVGHVKLASPPQQLTASSDKAFYKPGNGGYVELIGNAKAVKAGNKVSGQRLRLTDSDKTTTAKGNVQVVYYPEKKANSAAVLNAETADKAQTADKAKVKNKAKLKDKTAAGTATKAGAKAGVKTETKPGGNKA